VFHTSGFDRAAAIGRAVAGIPKVRVVT